MPKTNASNVQTRVSKPKLVAKPKSGAASRTKPKTVKLPNLTIWGQERSDQGTRESGLFQTQNALRSELLRRWVLAQQPQAGRQDVKQVNYLSMEFLMGRTVGNALMALSIDEKGEFDPSLNQALSKELKAQGLSLDQVIDAEPDAALGNGGLGRLAACFLDAFASVGIRSFGYGLRYQHGMFSQRIEDGRQLEVPENWLKNGNPLEVVRNEISHQVGFSGRVQQNGGVRQWHPAEVVVAQAHDLIVPGRGTEHVSTLRLWKASASQPIDFVQFSRGEIAASGQHCLVADSLNWVLYPDDSSQAGRELRLRQEFLLVSASLQDMLARHIALHGDVESFGRNNAVHLNDTHPGLAPAELMRLLMDVHGLSWNLARRVTQDAMSYTCHTLMPEALESWPIALLERLLPRHLEIIYEINQRFLNRVAEKFPGDVDLMRRVSLVDESGERRVRMAALAVVTSNRVNGVSALHSQLMVETIFTDFARIWPAKFINVTNGVTLTRWVMHANPSVSTWLDKRIGSAWRADASGLIKLKPLAQKPVVQKEFLAAKRINKERLAQLIRRETGITVSIDSLFDVQVKRIHEYKRQLLNLMHVVARYQAILANPDMDWVPRTVVFAGKAASAYVAAKQTIRLIHDVARIINSDPLVGDRLKLVFLPNYGVSLAETIIPAADLSEQISTAGTEASGTGNMKFALNGALTIGTWDGANIEMANAMGPDNMFVFGLRTHEVESLKQVGYDPRLYYEGNRHLSDVIDAISGGVFSPNEPDRYRPMMQQLLRHDPFFLLADFAAYFETQLNVDALYRNQQAWACQAIVNIASMGEFSADHTIEQYAKLVWSMPPEKSARA